MWETSLYHTSKVTLELRDIVDNGENSVNIWDFDYPSYYKGVEKSSFEQKVIDHYYFRQIGQETVGRWLHYFRSRIREIMPNYIRLYESVKLMDELENPFDNVDVTETFEQEIKGESSGQSTGSSQGTTAGDNTTSHSSNTVTKDDKTHRFSNTPQGAISNLDSYLTEASVDDNTNTEEVKENTKENSKINSTASSTESNNNSNTQTMKHTLTKKGNQGVNTYAHDIIEYRQALIDVDMMIIEDLNELFLGAY